MPCSVRSENAVAAGLAAGTIQWNLNCLRRWGRINLLDVLSHRYSLGGQGEGGDRQSLPELFTP